MRNTGLVALAFGVGIWALVLAPGHSRRRNRRRSSKVRLIQPRPSLDPTHSVSTARRVTGLGEGGTARRRRPSESHRRI